MKTPKSTESNLKNENREEVAISIIERHDNEKKFDNKVIGRVAVEINKKNKLFWLTSRSYQSSSLLKKNISGDTIGVVDSGRYDTLINDGTNSTVINKNDKLGRFFSDHSSGTHMLDLNGNEVEIKLYDRTFFNPFTSSLKGDMIFHYEEKPLYFDDISDVFNEENKYAVSKNQKTDNRKQKIMPKKSGRDDATLQFLPNLDIYQNRIKSAKVYEGGALTINGGPGTGKTTTLIQRLKFLIDNDAIDSDPKLFRNVKKEIVNDEDHNWMFFSPNELLKSYLKKNMGYEGLNNIANKVVVWDKYLIKLMTNYKLAEVETKDEKQFKGLQMPFWIMQGVKSKKDLFLCNPKSIIDDFSEFYLNTHKESLQNFSQITVSGVMWLKTAFRMSDIAKNASNASKLDDLFIIYLSLSEVPTDSERTMVKKLSINLEKESDRIVNITIKDPCLHKQALSLLRKWKVKRGKVVDKKNEMNIRDQNELKRKIKSLVKKLFLSKYDSSVRFSAEEREIYLLLPEHYERSDIYGIGNVSYYQKKFEPYTIGIEEMLSTIPVIYKDFRKEMFKSSSDKWNLLLLKELVEKKSNKLLHPSEQALLIGFINNLLKRLYSQVQGSYKNLKHNYSYGYKESCRPVIGIDEVTDYSVFDIYAMHSLSHYEFSSVTMSGDLMQRLTRKGITNWVELNDVIPSNTIMDLTISYRQSTTLLDVAKRIHKDTLGYAPEYVAGKTYSDNEPKPLLFCSADEDAKIKWIANRILEINSVYKSLPSIAVFLDNKKDIPDFVNQMNTLGWLQSKNIKIKEFSSSNLEEKNTVRVFPLDVVKGLEFDVAIFHNVDKYYMKYASDDLLERFLYVGLSRASEYLAATVSDAENVSITKYFSLEKNYWGDSVMTQ